MEQILVRNLPEGTKAALRSRALCNERSLEAEVRSIIVDSLTRDPPTLVDLLSTDEGADIEFDPVRLNLEDRVVDL